MKLQKNAFYTKFYLWVYGLEEDDLPKSLCPFFWMSLLGLLIAPFRFVTTAPAIVIDVFKKWKVNRHNKKISVNYPEQRKRHYPTFDNYYRELEASVISYLALLFLLIEVKGFVHLTKGWYATDFAVTFITTFLILLLVLFVLLLYYLYDTKIVKRDEFGHKIRKPKKDPDENPTVFRIARKAIKAWYEKNCPLVEWK